MVRNLPFRRAHISLVLALCPLAASADLALAGSRYVPLEQVGMVSPSFTPETVPPRGLIWQQDFERQGAETILIHLERLTLGTGDALEVLNARGELLLHATEVHNGRRWLPSLPGDRVTLRLLSDGASRGPFVHIDLVGFTMPSQDDDPSRAICNVAAGPDGLLDDITCYKDPPPPPLPGPPCINGLKYARGTGVVRLTRTVENLRTHTLERLLPDCSGFLIQSMDHDGQPRRIIMTAGHCLWDDEADGDIYRLREVEVEFGAEYGVGGPGGDCQCWGAAPPAGCGARPCDNPYTACMGATVAADSWVIAPDCLCDWGLIHLAAEAPAAFQALPLAPGMPIGNEFIFIPQHPDGRCKEIGDGVWFEPIDECKFRHDVDTQGGSSGAPVIDSIFGQVIGVHTSATGIPGACPNLAVRVDAITPHLPMAIDQLRLVPRPREIVNCECTAMGGAGPGRYSYQVIVNPDLGSGEVCDFHVGVDDGVAANYTMGPIPPGWGWNIMPYLPSHLTRLGATAHGAAPGAPPGRHDNTAFWLNWFRIGTAPCVQGSFTFSFHHAGPPHDVEWVSSCDGDDMPWNQPGVRDSAEWWVGSFGRGQNMVHGPTCPEGLVGDACEPARACCPPNGVCLYATQFNCSALGGVWANDPAAPCASDAPPLVSFVDPFDGPCLLWNADLNNHAASFDAHFASSAYVVTNIVPVANPGNVPFLQMWRNVAAPCSYVATATVAWDHNVHPGNPLEVRQRLTLHLLGDPGFATVVIEDDSASAGPLPRINLNGSQVAGPATLSLAGQAMLRLYVQPVGISSIKYTGQVLVGGNPILEHSAIQSWQPTSVRLRTSRAMDPAAPFTPVRWEHFVIGASAPACPGDANNDGQRNGADIGGFIQCVVSGGPECCQADVNGSGAVDLADVGPFVAALLAAGPCP